MHDFGWLVGLDYGQTRVKAVLVDPATGEVAAMRAAAPPNREGACSIGAETYRRLSDPEALVETGFQLIRDLALPGRGPVAIAVSSAGPPLVAVDRDLRPVWPVVGHWDGVGTEELDEHLPYNSDRFYAETGSPRWYHPPVFHLAWLKAHDPIRAENVAGVLSIGGYVAARLSGVMATEPSTAGASGAFDRTTRAWSPALIRAGNLNPDWFPEVRPAGTALGENRWLMPGRRVLVSTGAHDYLAAALAAGITGPSMSLNVLGTWEMAVQFVKIGAEGGWGGGEPHDVLHDLHVLPGLGTQSLECWSGGQMEWARRLLSLSPSDFLAAADSAPLQAPIGHLYAPFLGPQFFPHQSKEIRAAFSGLDARVGPGDLARMVVEGLAYLGARMFEILETGRPGPAPALIMTGGATRGRITGQLKADMLNRTVYVHKLSELSAVGAALLAGVGAGYFEGLEQAAALFRNRVTPVDPDRDRHAAYRDAFDALAWA